MKLAIVSLFLLFGGIFFVGQADALILINEILADPASGPIGDANQDGVTNSSQDEFIELWNPTSFRQSLAGWSLSDALKLRHQFLASDVIEAGEYIAIFGGGNVTGVNMKKASSGSLSLNNSGDVVRLYDDQNIIVDQVVFGREAGQNQSITRDHRQTNDVWGLHSLIDTQDQSVFSPATATIPDHHEQAIVPEVQSLWLFMSGLGVLWRFRLW